MEAIRNELCKRHNISWFQRRFLKDVRSIWMCALNREDWTFVEKLLEMFPAELQQELYEVSWGVFNWPVDANINLIRIIVSTFSKSHNIYYVHRAFEAFLNMFIYRDQQSVRQLNRFYESCKPAIEELLEKCKNFNSTYYNIYLHILVGRDVKQRLTSLFDVAKYSDTMRNDFSRFIYMCIILNRCDIIETIYQTMKQIPYSPPIYTVGFMRHSARVIQRRWRMHLARREKQKLAKLCYGMGIPGNVAYVIYKHSGIENAFKKI